MSIKEIKHPLSFTRIFDTFKGIDFDTSTKVAREKYGLISYVSDETKKVRDSYIDRERERERIKDRKREAERKGGREQQTKKRERGKAIEREAKQKA